MSLDRSDHAALVMNDDIIVIGGGTHDPSFRPLANGEMVKSGRQFPLRYGADRTCAVIVNTNQFLVIGGYTDDRQIGGDITDGNDGKRREARAIHGKVHRYNSDGEFLETLPDLNHRRAEHACTTFVTAQGEEGVLVVGGSGRIWATMEETTEIFLPSTGRWTEASPIIGDKAQSVRAALYNQQIIIVGGIGAPSNAIADEIYAYDAEADSWKELASLEMGRCRHAITQVNLTAVCLGDEAAVWQQWTEWSQCTKTCQQGAWGTAYKGSRTRSRACSVPPYFGKDQCVGDSAEVETCDNLPQCEEATVVLSSTGGAAETFGGHLGEFAMAGEHGGRPYFKQRNTEDGDTDVFFFSHGGQWLVTVRLGKPAGELTNDQDSPLPPVDGWLYWDWERKRHRDDDTSLTLEFASLSPCQMVRVAGEGEVVEEHGSQLGDYRLEVGRWSSGRPVFKKVNGEEPRFLFVPDGGSHWTIKSSTNVTGATGAFIVSGRATNSPSSPEAGPRHRLGWTGWHYSVQWGDSVHWEEGDISVTCP